MPYRVKQQQTLHAAFFAASIVMFVLAVGFVLPLAASAHAIPSCPIEAAENRIIVALEPGQFLSGSGSGSGPYWVTIPSGTYDITLASFDSHKETGEQGEASERWQLKMLDSGGLLLGVTALTSDLPDADDVRVEKVNVGFVVPSDIAKLRPFHPDEGNDIRPLCAAFDRVSAISTDGTNTGTTGGGSATTTPNDSGTSTGSDTTSTASSGGGANCSECGGIGGGGVTITPLVVSEEQARWLGSVIVVTWKTNIPATSRVYYGTQSVEPPLLTEHLGYSTSTLIATTTLTEHTVEIIGADQSKTYYLRPASQETPEQNFRIVGRELRLSPLGPVAVAEVVSTQTDMRPTAVTGVSIDRSTTNTCGPYITSFIKTGAANNPTDVSKLQLFLWQYEGLSDLRMTGVYDEPTRRAVDTFQIRYAADVLIPWGLTSPTSHFYITTQKKLNELYCARARGIPTEFVLGSAELEEIRSYREWLEAERRKSARPTEGMSSPRPQEGMDKTGNVPTSEEPDFVFEQLEPSTGNGTPKESSEPDASKRGVLDGAALIVGEIGDRFATATKTGLIGALFAGFSGPSAPTFLGILSLVLLIVGALMLVRSLRSGRSGDSDRGSAMPPSPPQSPRGMGPSGPRTPPSPSGETRGMASMPPPPVPPRTPLSSNTGGGSPARVFEMPPASGARVTTPGTRAGSDSPSAAPLLRGGAGSATRPSFGAGDRPTPPR